MAESNDALGLIELATELLALTAGGKGAGIDPNGLFEGSHLDPNG